MYRSSNISHAPSSYAFATHHGNQVSMIHEEGMIIATVAGPFTTRSREDAERVKALIDEIAALVVNVGS